MLIISILVKRVADQEDVVTDNNDKPGHLARRFQQIAVAIFHAEIVAAGHDLTPVQYAALSTIKTRPGIDQVTLAGLIAYDRTTITGVVDRLVQKGLLVRRANSRDRRARVLQITDQGQRTLDGIEPAVEAAQRIMLRGLTTDEAEQFMRLLRKAIDAGNDLSRAPLRPPREAAMDAVGTE
jgi:DNA-binding MarR family transcriptional regulator